MRLAIVCDRGDFDMVSAHLTESPSIVCVSGDEPLTDLGNPDIVILWNSSKGESPAKDRFRHWRPSGQHAPILAVASQCNNDNESPELILDREGLCAEVGEQRVQLTRTQFAILDYLVVHRDCWRHSDAIIRDVLGTCHQKNTSLMRFHIHKLRAALGEYGAFIHWQRGKGYMFSTMLPPAHLSVNRSLELMNRVSPGVP